MKKYAIKIDSEGFAIEGAEDVPEGEILMDILNLYGITAEKVIEEHVCDDSKCEVVAFNRAMLKNMEAVNEKFNQIRGRKL